MSSKSTAPETDSIDNVKNENDETSEEWKKNTIAMTIEMLFVVRDMIK
jgi:hypothetical protein